MPFLAVLGFSIRAATEIPNAAARAERVEIVGDFAPRSTSEIIEEETPFFFATARTVRLRWVRRDLIAPAILKRILSSIMDQPTSRLKVPRNGFREPTMAETQEWPTRGVEVVRAKAIRESM